MTFEADCKQKYPQFSLYEKGGQGHDAGYDAFMTGLVFATSAKCIEIGKIVSKVPGYEHVNKVIDEEIGLSQTSQTSHGFGFTPSNFNDCSNFGVNSGSSSSKSGTQNKRTKKAARKEQQLRENCETVRKVKHFSSVQNKPIYLPDIDHFRNKTMQR